MKPPVAGAATLDVVVASQAGSLPADSPSASRDARAVMLPLLAMLRAS